MSVIHVDFSQKKRTQTQSFANKESDLKEHKEKLYQAWRHGLQAGQANSIIRDFFEKEIWPQIKKDLVK